MIFLKNIFNRVPKHLWILSAIILFGIFLRTYNFHNWLDFGSDQVNDANRVGYVISGSEPWPAYGPDMGNSGTGNRESRFRLGPIYYDFEIISAKLFGNNPVSMAYPDLLFSILSIPLFYYFFRKIFSINFSLALTGLYAISFYTLSFSHSAWNVNSIPFFSLLFLLSLYEFIAAEERTHWGWIAALGTALGVSVQLHAILLVLFPASFFFVCLFLIKKSPRVWKKIGVVIFITIVLNLGQIIGDQQNGFKNAITFWNSATGYSIRSEDNIFVRTANGISCNFQANTYMLSSVGSYNCDFSLVDSTRHDVDKKILKKVSKPLFIFEAIFCVIFSIVGYGLFLYYYRKEKQQKRKYFFGIIILYSILSFFVMLPVMDAPLRYFVHILFVPFIFLGLAVDLLMRKFSKKYFIAMAIIIFGSLVAVNSFSVYSEVKDEFSQSRIILGQVEAMVDYMISQSGSQKKIYVLTTKKTDSFFKSLNYVANERGISLIRVGDGTSEPSRKPDFYLSYIENMRKGFAIDGYTSDSYRNFKQLTIFHVTN